MITAVDAPEPEPEEPEEKPIFEQIADYRKNHKEALQAVVDTVAAPLVK